MSTPLSNSGSLAWPPFPYKGDRTMLMAVFTMLPWWMFILFINTDTELTHIWLIWRGLALVPMLPEKMSQRARSCGSANYHCLFSHVDSALENLRMRRLFPLGVRGGGGG